MLGPLHRLLAYLVLALLFASGLVHLLLHDYFPLPGPLGPSPRPLEISMLRLHGGAAMATLVLLGSVLGSHVLRFWRHGQNRTAGALFLGALALLGASGYGLYYLDDQWLRGWTREAHIAIGLAALPVFLWHLRRGRERRATCARTSA